MDGCDPTPPPQTPPAPITRRHALLHALSVGGVVGLLIAVGVEVYNATVGGNLHEVIPGTIYRSGEPTPQRLEAFVQKYGIRTVVNLRGCCDPTPWYLAESQATVRLDLSQEDLPFSAGRLPSVPVIRELVEVLDRSDKPLLVHCHQGIDRTGMASAMAILLYTDSSLDEALYQLGPRFGHLPWGRTGNIDRFFELYREWLTAKGYPHSRTNFRHWIEHEYCPGECLAALAIVAPPGQPLVMRRGEPLAVRVRCTNQSVKPWRFRPGTNAGIHLFWQLVRPNDELMAEGRSGMYYATVAPRESIELTLALSSLPQAGGYRLRIDMVDEQHAHFHQLGPEPLVVELEVR